MLRRGLAVAVISILSILTSEHVIAQDGSRVWQQSQMTEDYMRELTKWECVEKTRLTLSAGCGASTKCIKTMAGLLGDCVTYATGDINAFCEAYPSWRRQACFKNDFDGRACVFFEISEKSLCETTQKK